MLPRASLSRALWCLESTQQIRAGVTPRSPRSDSCQALTLQVEKPKSRRKMTGWSTVVRQEPGVRLPGPQISA